MKKVILSILVSVVLISCGQKEKKEVVVAEENPFADFEWVVGVWTNINAETESYETWLRNGDSELVGSSITLRGKDTVFAERMKIYPENGTMKLYVETVGTNPNPVVFSLKEDAEHPFTFENPRNEFPSQIVYTQPEPNKIKAWVAGFIDSIPQKQEFYFVRE